ncbi:MAG: glycosyltransferase family 4 protein [Lachnospiraceae bacterium]|nr:glycosyltransferase family 4 protein [Lachnospiraceae bacterium]
MRIMFAVPSYWPSQDGVACITKYLAEGLAGRDHEVLIYTSAGNGGLQILPEHEEHERVSIERTRVYVRWPLKLKGRDDKSTPAKYYERVCSFKPDVLIVICAQTWTLDWIIPYLDEIKCVKVFYSHGYSQLSKKDHVWEPLKRRNLPGVYENWKIKRYYQKLYRTLRKFDLAVYLSELNNSYLYSEEHKLTNGKILENAVEDVFLSEDIKHSAESFLRPDIQFLYVANYNDNKNQDMLLEAFCKAKIENATLQMAGFEENDYLEMMRSHLAQWMPEDSEKNVVFNVHLTREQICELYKTSDVFVCTSKSENCPIVHCEAAASGMAVISTNVGDVSLKDGIILVDDKEQLQQAMERLYHDRQELIERGRRLRAYMMGRKCRIEDKVDWLEEELMRLCRERQNGNY